MPIANNICSSIVLQWDLLPFQKSYLSVKKQCKVLKK